MPSASRMIQTANLPECRSGRRTLRPAPTAQLAIAFDGEPERDLGWPLRSLSPIAPGNTAAPDRTPAEARAAAAALAAHPASPSPRARDWTGLREGAREVFVTLMATIAIGLAFAAIEAGRQNEAVASSLAVSDGGSR